MSTGEALVLKSGKANKCVKIQETCANGKQNDGSDTNNMFGIRLVIVYYIYIYTHTLNSNDHDNNLTFLSASLLMRHTLLLCIELCLDKYRR